MERHSNRNERRDAKYTPRYAEHVSAGTYNARYLAVDQPIETNREVQRAVDELVGEHADIVAGIRAGRRSNADSFVVVKRARARTADDEFLLLSDNGGILPIGELPVTVGRSHHQDHFAYSDHVSRNHFMVIHYNGADEEFISVRDMRSKNGTFVTGRIIPTYQLGVTIQYHGEADDDHPAVGMV